MCATLNEAFFSGLGCFIYGLVDPRDGMIRYVGKATGGVDGLVKRLSRHCTEARCGKTSHRARWVASLLKEGFKPFVVVLEVVPAIADWQLIEREWIAFLRDRVDLTNTLPGGEGGDTSAYRRDWHPTAEQRKRMGDARRGMKMPASMRDPEFLQRRGKAIKVAWDRRKQEGHGGRSSPFWGHHTPESLEKIREAAKRRKGRPLSVEHREKLRQAHLGRKQTPEIVQHRVAVIRQRNPDHWKDMRAKRKG
jgi:hypothetical protein